MSWKNRLLAAFVLLITAQAADAELIVNIGSLNLAAGQTTGTVDVTISSSDGSSINLNSFGFNFLITPENGAPPELAFVDPQPQPFGATNYVFADSFDNDITSPLGNVSTTSTPNDTYSGSDATGDFSNVAIPSIAGPKLLTQLQVMISPQFLQTKASFNISLVPGSYAGSPATPSSEVFFTAADLSAPGGFDYLTFQSNFGTINIPTAVPEPSSIVLLVVSFLLTPLIVLFGQRKTRGRPSMVTENPS